MNHCMYPFHFISLVLICVNSIYNSLPYSKILGWLLYLLGIKPSFGNDWKISMVFKDTITIEWNGWRQPLRTVVFRWFWGQSIIGNDGWPPLVQWWNGYILEVYINYLDMPCTQLYSCGKRNGSGGSCGPGLFGGSWWFLMWILGVTVHCTRVALLLEPPPLFLLERQEHHLVFWLILKPFQALSPF